MPDAAGFLQADWIHAPRALGNDLAQITVGLVLHIGRVQTRQLLVEKLVGRGIALSFGPVTNLAGLLEDLRPG